MEFWLSYGKTEVPVAVPDENLLAFLSPADGFPSQNLGDAINAASQYRVGEHGLFEAAKQVNRTVIAFNADSPASTALSNLLAEGLSQAGAAGVLMLEGAHDPTQPPSSPVLPENILDRPAPLERHDRKTSRVVKVGELEGGAEALVNEAFAAADIRCIVTNVSVNPLWGYSGGPSFLLSRLAAESTIRTCLGSTVKRARLPAFLSENPTYEALLLFSKMLSVDFAVHVVEGPDGKVAGVFAGDLMETFQHACGLAEKMFRPPLRARADIVISSAGGSPWDRTLFDASPGALMASAACKDHGILVLVAECADGLGGFGSARLGFRDAKGQTTHSRKGFSLERVVEYSFQRLCADHRVYLVSTLPEHNASSYGLLAARSVGSAYQRATRHGGKDASVVLISHGCLTVPLIG